MMKKILSIIMSFCMLLTLVAVPVNVFAAEDTVVYEDTTLGSYYKFTFGEEEMYNYVKDATVEYKGNNITPLYYQNATGASVGYKEVTDSVTGDKYDTLQLQSGSAIMFTPLTKDGQPFELKPGVDYTFKVNLFIPVAHCWTHAFVAVGYQDKAEHIWGKYVNVGSAETPSYISSNYPFYKHVSLTNQGGSGWAYAFKDGTYGKTSTFSTIEGSTGVCLHKEDERFGVTCSHASYTGHKPYLQKTGAITIPAERFTLGEDNVYTSVLDIYSDNKGTDSGKDATVNNFFTLYLGGGSASQYAKSNYGIYGNYTYDDMYDEEGKNIPIYDTYQIESIEIYETGKGVANIHVGDTVTKVSGEAGTAIDLSIPEAPEGKYFVAWYTDAEYTTPVTSAQTIVEGASLDFYARFEEYGSYVKNDYTSNTYPNTVIQQTTAGYYYAAHGYSYKGNTYRYGTTDSVLKTTDGLIKELEAKGLATTPESGTLMFFSDRTWGMPGGIVAYNEDGTLFMPEAGAQYKVTYRYRSLVNNGNDMAINITYGISDTFANTATTADKTPHKSTLKYNTLADVVPEWTVKSEVITIPATTTGYVPSIGLYIGAAKKVAVYAEDGTTVTGYTHTVVELDYLEVEKVKNVTFTAADGSTSTGAYVNGEAITYPELTDGDWYEAVWSLSEDEYIEVPETMGDTDITVYEFHKKTKNIITYVNGSNTSYKYFANGEKIDYTKAANAVLGTDYAWSASATEYIVPDQTASKDITVYWIALENISFENQFYNQYGSHAWLNTAMVSDKYAYHGTKSLKIENYNINLRPSRYVSGSAAANQYEGSTSDDWGNASIDKPWNRWYTYDAATDTFTHLNSDTDPGWEANKYYYYRAGNATESGLFYVKDLGPSKDSEGNRIKYTYSYKVSFKYYAPEANADGFTVNAVQFIPTNIWWGSSKVGTGPDISADATDGWQTYEFLISANELTTGGTQSGSQAVAVRVQPKNYNTGNARDSILYIDDVVVEEYVNTPTVVFHDGETVTEVTEGVTAGAVYTPALVGTNAPEGLSFKGWSTTADGLNIVETVTMPAATQICKVHLYAVYGADPTIVYHDNGVETVIEEGIEGGAEYVIDRVGAGVEGKYFAGWATTENGTSYVSKITVTEAGDAKNHLYAVYIAYPDNVTYDVSGATQPTLQGYPTLTDGVISDITLTETGWAQKKYTADGVHFEKSLGGAYKWNPALDGTSNAHGQTGSRSDLIASTEDNPVGTQVYGGWSALANYVIRDKNGNAVIAKPNTNYAVIVTYEKTGNGKQTLAVGMGRQAGYVSTGANATSVSPYNRFYTGTYQFADDPKMGETQLVFQLSTKEFSAGDVPVISLHYSGDAVVMERVAADANGVESYTLANGTTYYPYKVIEAPSILIKSVEIIEIDSGNVGVTFMRYDVENETFIPEFKEGTIGAPLDVDTHNYDPKWYNSDTRITGSEVVTTYPSKAATYYNATYGQLNPVAGTYVTGDGWKNGGEEKQWIFENTLYDGKYALHIGEAKVAIGTGDAETYMTGVKLEQGHTYKVSFKYKATAAHGNFGFTFRACQADNMWSAGTNPNKGSVSVAAGDATDGWVTKNAYFTADFTGTVTDENETGLDYNVTRESRRTLQMVFSQDANEAGNDLYFADIEVIDLGAAVVEEGGASVLTEEVAIKENKQAMRFYFNYKTDDGSNIYIGDDKLTVVERGFYYRNGYVANGGTVATMYSTNVQQSKTENFNTCWAYNEETKMMTFSTYIVGFGLNDDDRKLEVNAYIIVEDAEGNRYTIYADSINRTVAGVKDAGGATDNDFFAGS